jgi:spore coat protein U-like protein
MGVLRIIKSPLIVATLASLAFVSSPAMAATSTTTFTVSTTIQATCLVSATSLAFGTYTGLVADSASTVSVTCTNTTPYNIGLNSGTASGATVTARKMAGPNSALLNYSLFTDTSRTLNWGETAGTDTVSGTGNGSAQTLTVYGRIPAGQYLAPGNYSDTITATVTY